MEELVLRVFWPLFNINKKRVLIRDESWEEKWLYVYDIPTLVFLKYEDFSSIYWKFPENLIETIKKIKYDVFKNAKITERIINEFRWYFYKHPDFLNYAKEIIEDYDVWNGGVFFSEFVKYVVSLNIYSDLDARNVLELRFYVWWTLTSKIKTLDFIDIENDWWGKDNKKTINKKEKIEKKETTKKMDEQRRDNKERISEDWSKITSIRCPKEIFVKLWNALRFDRFITDLWDKEDEEWLKNKAIETIDFLYELIKKDPKNNILEYKSYMDRDNLDMSFVNRVEKLVMFAYNLDKSTRQAVKKYNTWFIKEALEFKPQWWQKFFLVMQNRENLVATSRRAWKSYSSMYLAIRQLFLPSQMIIFVIPSKEWFSEQPFFYAKKFVENIKKKWMVVDWMSTNAKDFKLINNEVWSKIIFVSAMWSNKGARSFSANLVILDEAAYISDWELYDVAYATTATVKWVILAVSTINKDTPINWFYYKKIDLGAIDTWLSITVDLYNNPFIPEFEKKSIEKKYKDKNPLIWNCEWMAIFNTQQTKFAINNFFVIDFQYTILEVYWLKIKIKQWLNKYDRFIIWLDPARDKDKSWVAVVWYNKSDMSLEVVSTFYAEYKDYIKQTKIIFELEKYLKKFSNNVDIALDLWKGWQVVFDYYRDKWLKPYWVYSTWWREINKKSYREYLVPKWELESLLATAIDEQKVIWFTFLDHIKDEFETYEAAEERKTSEHHHDIISALMVALFVMYERHYVWFSTRKVLQEKRKNLDWRTVEEIFLWINNNQKDLSMKRMQHFLY